MVQEENSQQLNFDMLRKAVDKISEEISTFGIRATDAKDYFERCSRKIKCNNWRKMHGIPMHRRRGRCKSLKNGKPEKQRKNSGKKTFG